jgi:hypothetical protein
MRVIQKHLCIKRSSHYFVISSYVFIGQLLISDKIGQVDWRDDWISEDGLKWRGACTDNGRLHGMKPFLRI